jgi:hypothetical protein
MTPSLLSQDHSYIYLSQPKYFLIFNEIEPIKVTNLWWFFILDIFACTNHYHLKTIIKNRQTNSNMYINSS